MSIKIGQTTELPSATAQASTSAAQRASQQASATENSNATGSNAVAAKSARSAGVAVTVSTQLRALEQTDDASASDIDSQKVALVKSSIQDGTYVVNPEAIADKLLSSSQELLSRASS